MAGEDLIVKDAPVLSLHQRILDDIESRILSGEWLPGHRIPFRTMRGLSSLRSRPAQLACCHPDELALPAKLLPVCACAYSHCRTGQGSGRLHCMVGPATGRSGCLTIRNCRRAGASSTRPI